MRVVLVPGVLALLSEYAGLVDPVARLRAACLEAVAWVGEGGRPVTIVADGQGGRVARSLLSAAGGLEAQADGAFAPRPPDAAAGSYLVVGNGSARRGEKAPGHLDERASAFDEALGKALLTPDPVALAALDVRLGEELLAGGLDALRRLGDLLTADAEVVVDYGDDPFGVQYWVVRWACGS